MQTEQLSVEVFNDNVESYIKSQIQFRVRTLELSHCLDKCFWVHDY